MSASNEALLDRPIWSALTTSHKHLAEGGPRALRYPVDMTPFADMVDMSAASFAALGDLMSGSQIAVLFTPEPVEIPAAFKVLLAEPGEQIIGSPADTSLRDAEIVRLGAADVPAMMALTELTKPGPFAARTHELGTFLGIRARGELVAMAGERMKPGHFTEMTAVCVHPDHRGRGYAQALLAAIARRIEARGEIPFLHVFSHNTSAIALYQRQGMRIRRRLHVTVLMKQG
ncbi:MULTISPECIES: GNAT family N-acetyltransferase [Bradyrhizobium]|uniref:GNAT family N-acetyltransferase n=2 Tax=Nitrobacteraceae TaxID=41294 RepID=UPI00041E7DE5|nr:MULTISPECIES: GNAT family N-acetyltransferase [Bradyrhizobium]WLB90757.1 GNAT family N-acetyltransferase [Bradyrhizobium japonicum USDA 135]GLR98566.1 GNAT family N-acetyltransferase [Bradyrhizobium liaoningense]